jgi:hypothetical protein
MSITWTEYDDLLDVERTKLDDQISDAERRLRDAEKNITERERVRRLLSGGESTLVDAEVLSLDVPGSDLARLIRSVRKIVAEINTQQRRSRDEQLTLERLLEGPQDIQGVTLGSGLSFDGSLTFSQLANAVVEQEGDINGMEPFAVDLTVNHIERLWQDFVSDVDVKALEQQIETNRQTLNQLLPIKEQLNQDNPELQVAALGQLAPDAVAGLLSTAPPVRNETVSSQVAALQNYGSPKVAPQLSSISVSENPELSAAMRYAPQSPAAAAAEPTSLLVPIRNGHSLWQQWLRRLLLLTKTSMTVTMAVAMTLAMTLAMSPAPQLLLLRSYYVRCRSKPGRSRTYPC